MAELASHHGWLQKVDEEGRQLSREKPQFGAVVSQRLTELHQLWDKLQSMTEEKAQHLFDANHSDLYAQSFSDLDKWIGEMETQLQSDEQGTDLTSTNRLLTKLMRLDEQVITQKREMEELLSQAPPPKGDMHEADSKQQS
ncbi:spectrin beta, erythrocytic, partial [Chelydra serpentina]